MSAASSTLDDPEVRQALAAHSRVLQPNDCGHQHLGVHRTDPTQTQTLRGEYGAKSRKRYRLVKGWVNDVVVEADALHLAGNVGPPDFDSNRRDPPPGYSFPDDPSKQSEFETWLERALANAVLERLPAGGRWSDQYVRSAYRSGVKHAHTALKSAGVDVEMPTVSDVFSMPIHTDKLQALYRRQFSALKGINGAVGSEVSRVLTEGLGTGQGPRAMARTIADRIDKIGITRATVMARTEVVRSHNNAAARRYQDVLGEDAEVVAEVEFSTSDDEDVCPRCESLEGRVFKAKLVPRILPVHPQCRCSVLPVIQ